MNTYRVTIIRTRQEIYAVRATSIDEAIETWALGDQLAFDEGDTEVYDVEQVRP